MKKGARVILSLLTGSAFLLTACGCSGSDEKNGKRFNPDQKESAMSDAERYTAIAAKKGELAVSIDSLLMLDGVNFSVLPPAVGEWINKVASERIATKLIGIAAKYGISGVPVNPVLGLVTKVVRTESTITGTAPQKTIVKYELTFYCGNFVSDEIYASTTTSVTGVGGNEESATLQAFTEMKDSPKFKEMLQAASAKAIAWYNNEANVTSMLDQLLAQQKYAEAMAFLSSVPAQASTRAMAVRKNAEVSNLFFLSKAEELFRKMKSAIAASNGEYNPEAGACYALIPQNSKIWAEADKAFNQYCARLESDRHDAIARARAVEDRDALNAHLLEMEKLQVEKIKAPYEAQAAIAQIDADAKVAVAEANAKGKANANTGGFLGLGKFWDGSFGLVNRMMDKLED